MKQFHSKPLSCSSSSLSFCNEPRRIPTSSVFLLTPSSFAAISPRMAFGLTIGTERSSALQTAIQDELTKRGFSNDADPVMAEYITIMIINNKTPAQIAGELEDLIGADFGEWHVHRSAHAADIRSDPSFVDWLFAEASKGAPESEAPPAAEPSTSTQPPARESPPHLPPETPRRPPHGPRSGAPIYQQAISQATSPSPSAQKRTASARSPSPSGQPSKTRRLDVVPTGPRAMFRDRDGAGTGAGTSGGARSLLERVGPARNNGGGHGPYPLHDDIQARIDNITGNSPDPNMMMLGGGGGFPMNGMGGMDMSAMAGMTNPMLLQEMMMNQMALMSQMAGAMGILNPALLNGGAFPMQPGMGGEKCLCSTVAWEECSRWVAGMVRGAEEGGERGRGGSGMRGSGRGRGGRAASPHIAEPAMTDGAQVSPAPSTTPVAAPAVVAPTPTPANITPQPPLSASAVTHVHHPARTGFVPPERPQSPTLCKFGLKCTNPVCRYSHPSPVATAESGVVLSNEPCEKGKDCKDKDCVKAHVSPAVLNPHAELLKPATYASPAPAAPQSTIPCRFGLACTRPGCPYVHPSRPAPDHYKSHFVQPCRFGAACTRATCPFQHPEGRVLPSTFHRGLSTTGPLVNVSTPEAGSMNVPSPHKSVVFKKSDGAGKSAAELEKKVKEMEEKKSLAEKTIAEAEKAAAAGKKDDPSNPVSIAA
ncbi:hypothetical protein A0H81_10439 [Grifola frondosa]|uniref:Nab2 type CCCH zinc finger 4 domain-containing protein n=1 Tax=Grifola frondosa TaxID=5627 RepID=A0A1C7LZU0_GRIFR|nr:hypothetical protein A0H81_10439 [Grifola frondosa]